LFPRQRCVRADLIDGDGSALQLRRFSSRSVTTGQIVMFGLTGGLIPCPAAITVLLLCLQLKQITLGVVFGEPLTAAEIGDMIQRKSKQSFSTGFGPHRFRHALGTTAPLADPAHPGVAAAILGISGPMVEQHYNRATQADVASRFQGTLGKTRAERRFVAQREFRQKGSC
jgi:hypothetical protein